MKKFISIVLSIVLISLVACATVTDTSMVEIIPEGTELSGTLEISSLYSAQESTEWGLLHRDLWNFTLMLR